MRERRDAQRKRLTAADIRRRLPDYIVLHLCHTAARAAALVSQPKPTQSPYDVSGTAEKEYPGE